jgi:hypothetical protein
MDRLTAIDPVPQQVIERPPTKAPSPDRASGFSDTVLAANAQPVKLSLERKHAAKFQVSLEDQFDGFGRNSQKYFLDNQERIKHGGH